MRKILLIILMLIIPISGCNRSNDRSIKWNHPINIPSADIVFNTISEPEKGEAFGKDLLGFYSLQDQSVTILKIPNSSSPIKPYYLNSETIMTLNKMGNFGLVNEGRAYLSIFSSNQYIDCHKYIGDAFPHNGNILFFGYVNEFESVSIINKSDCSVEKTIFDSDDLSALKEYGIGLRSFSINEDYILLVSNDLHLFKFNLSDKKLLDYKKEGITPALSPDQKTIAYLAPDGIHIMDINGQNDELVVPYKSIISYSDGSTVNRINNPIPNWSSDSSKIVYHKCMLPINNCHSIKEYGIFIYDIKTRSEKLIFEGGMNPSWNYFK